MISLFEIRLDEWTSLGLHLLLDLDVPLLLLIEAIDVAVHAHALTVIGAVGVRTLESIAGLAAAKRVVAVVAHAFRIVLRLLVRTRRHGFPSSVPLLLAPDDLDLLGLLLLFGLRS